MSSEYKHIVRIKGTDIDGSKKIVYGISRIKGVGVNLANAIVNALGLNPTTRVGDLSDVDIEKIASAVNDPQKLGIRPLMLNRKRDRETGRDTHFTGSDLDLKIKSDIDFMKEIRSWRGVRHALGLKVRGQRTRTTGRTGRSVGVKKKRIPRAQTQR